MSVLVTDKQASTKMHKQPDRQANRENGYWRQKGGRKIGEMIDILVLMIKELK